MLLVVYYNNLAPILFLVQGEYVLLVTMNSPGLSRSHFSHVWFVWVLLQSLVGVGW